MFFSSTSTVSASVFQIFQIFRVFRIFWFCLVVFGFAQTAQAQDDPAASSVEKVTEKSIEKNSEDPRSSDDTPIFGEDIIIDRIEVVVANDQKPISPYEHEQIAQHYLVYFTGEAPTPKVAYAAELMLKKIPFYRNAFCSFRRQRIENSASNKKEYEKNVTLFCSVDHFQVLHAIRIRGLPWQSLEKELRKRIFIRSGNIIDEKKLHFDSKNPDDVGSGSVTYEGGDDAGETEQNEVDTPAENPTESTAKSSDTKNNVVAKLNHNSRKTARLIDRIQQYLSREGVYVGQINVDYVPTSKDIFGEEPRVYDVDMVITLRDVAYKQIDQVVVEKNGPLSEVELKNQFSSMCFYGNGFLEGLLRSPFQLDQTYLWQTVRVGEAPNQTYRTYEFYPGRWWGFNCNIRSRLVESVESVERKLRELGYPEGRVILEETPVTEKSITASHRTGSNCQHLTPEALLNVSAELKSDPSKKEAFKSAKTLWPCIELHIRVETGPRVLTQVALSPSSQDHPILPTLPPGNTSPTIKCTEEPAWLSTQKALLSPWLYTGSRFIEPPLNISTEEALETKLLGYPVACPALITDIVPQDEVKILAGFHDAMAYQSVASSDQSIDALSINTMRVQLGRQGYPNAEVKAERLVVDSEGKKQKGRILKDNAQVRVMFFVEPGEALAVTSVDIVGNRSIADEDLLSEAEILTTPRSTFSSGLVSIEDLEMDARRLEYFYQTQGYLDATVIVRGERKQAGQIHVSFVVDENTQYVVEKIKITSPIGEYDGETLRAMYHCGKDMGTRVALTGLRISEDGVQCAPTPYNPDEEEGEEQRILAVYAANGYFDLRANINRTFSCSEKNKDDTCRKSSVTLMVEVVPTTSQAKMFRQKRIGAVFVEGNAHTQQEALLLELGLGRGENQDRTLVPASIAKGLSTLRQTGLFTQANVSYINTSDIVEKSLKNKNNTDTSQEKSQDSETTTEIDDGNNDAHLLISIEEKSTFSVDASFGYSSLLLGSLRLEARDRSFMGAFTDLNGFIDMGLFIGRHSQVGAQARWPRVGGRWLGNSVDLVFTPLSATYDDVPTVSTPRVPQKPQEQTAIPVWRSLNRRWRGFIYDPSVQLDWRIADKVTASLGYQFRVNWIDPDADPIEPLSDQYWQTIDGLLLNFDSNLVTPVRTANISPSIRYADIDNLFDPHNGLAIDGYMRLGNPFLLAEQDFGVVGGQARAYWTLADRLTFAVNAKVRWAFLGGDDEAGRQLLLGDLLRLGGQTSVRGYQNNSIGLLTLGDDGRFLVREGLFGAVLNAEARLTVLRFAYGEIRPAVFFDAGVVTDDLTPFSREQLSGAFVDRRLGASVGAGIRYISPVGPIFYECAVSLLHNRIGDTQREFDCYFNFGYMF